MCFHHVVGQPENQPVEFTPVFPLYSQRIPDAFCHPLCLGEKVIAHLTIRGKLSQPGDIPSELIDLEKEKLFLRRPLQFLIHDPEDLICPVVHDSYSFNIFAGAACR